MFKASRLLARAGWVLSLGAVLVENSSIKEVGPFPMYIRSRPPVSW